MKKVEGAQPYFGHHIEDIVADIKRVLVSGELSLGRKTREFEELVAEQVGVKYAVAVNSGGTALELALKALHVQGKEVIVPTDTFIASVNAIVQAGGTPVLTDIKRDTLCLDPDEVRNKLNSKTAGVMLVHMFGMVSPDVVTIKEICRSNGLFLIEDAAHAHGASFAGLNAGAWGDAGCFSYYATKIITTGEGGMVTTNRDDIYEHLLSLRNHGKNPVTPLYEITSNNYRLSEIQAVLGVHQMRTLKENVDRRKTIAYRYRRQLAGVQGIEFLPEFEGAVHSYWRFPMYLDKSIDRDQLQASLQQNYGVRITWMYEPLCHLQPLLAVQYNPGDMPVAENSIKQLVCLPTHGKMTDEDIQYVIKSISAEIAKT